MQQSEHDKIDAVLNRARFALEKLQKTSDDLHRRRKEAKTLEEIAAVNLEAAELLQQLRKVSDAVHAGEMSTQQKTRRQNEANE